MRQSTRLFQILLVIAVAVVVGQVGFAQDACPNGNGMMPMGQVAPTESNSFITDHISGAPMQPAKNSRPASWPGSPPVDSTPWNPPDPSATVPMSEVKPCEGMRILARVGSEAILESEVAGAVNETIETNKAQIPPDQIEKVREMWMRQRLKILIQTKLIYADARRTIASEAWPNVEKQLTKEFEERHLDRMKQRAGVTTTHELDQKLRELGSSLEREKRAFIEQMLAEQWRYQQIKPNEEITYDQMVDYYHKHLDEFTTPAAVRWEELMVRSSKYRSRAEAQSAISQMGNQVLSGVPFEQVAKTSSDGATAADGGQWPFTSQGALANEELDAALFQLRVGEMSRILSSEKGFHIIRVVERKEKEVKPFLEAQVPIRDNIIKQRSERQFRDYMAKLEERTPVWTIYDSKDGSLQLAQPQFSQQVRR